MSLQHRDAHFGDSLWSEMENSLLGFWEALALEPPRQRLKDEWVSGSHWEKSPARRETASLGKLSQLLSRLRTIYPRAKHVFIYHLACRLW